MKLCSICSLSRAELGIFVWEGEGGFQNLIQKKRNLFLLCFPFYSYLNKLVNFPRFVLLVGSYMQSCLKSFRFILRSRGKGGAHLSDSSLAPSLCLHRFIDLEGCL